MDDAHQADPNANREWFASEWQFARENAPLEVLIPMMQARYAGLRGQTIVKVNRKQFEPHPLTGQAVRYYARKNKKIVFLPVLPELLYGRAEGPTRRWSHRGSPRRLGMGKRKRNADPREPLAA
jgi:hypothetical protein